MRKTAQDVANWFLSKSSHITNKKLQKLVYYAYAWYLVLFNENENELNNTMFDGCFEAWVHGAVCPELYRKYADFGAREIPQYTGELPDFNEDELDCLEQVWDVYGQYTGNQLEYINHQESPWQEQRSGLSEYEPGYRTISNKSMFKYYVANAR